MRQPRARPQHPRQPPAVCRAQVVQVAGPHDEEPREPRPQRPDAHQALRRAAVPAEADRQLPARHAPQVCEQRLLPDLALLRLHHQDPARVCYELAPEEAAHSQP
eukprot:1321838-Rhodomonas_salina.1